MKLLFKLAPLVLLAALPLAVRAADNQKAAEKPQVLRDESRVWIIRGLSSEYATTRKPLPRGNKGLPLRADGKIDEQELTQRLTDKGPAVRSGDVVQITAIEFQKDKIIFQINGGGKGKGHWYDRVQIGMGNSTGPITNQAPEANGSSIELLFDGRVPDITVDDVKQMLTPVLDFNRRSAVVLYTESLPKEVQEAIKNHKATVGMDREMVLAALGRPERKSRESKRGVEQEDWIYGVPPARITIVTFEGDKAVQVKELIPGVPTTDIPRADPPAVKKP